MIRATPIAGLLLALLAPLSAASAMPLPWKRELFYQPTPMTGNDVFVLQNLINRDSAVRGRLPVTSAFDQDTSNAVRAFQLHRRLPVTGIFDEKTANALLDCCSRDGVKDTGFTAASKGYKYKITMPVYTNRSVETMATLYDAVGNKVMSFRARSHGHRDDGSSGPWPDFSNDIGCNQFTSNCATVTGVIEIDLNSPEPDPDLYGPWPVNRLVRGLEGNAQWLLPNIRDGLLIHTGNWPGWNENIDMPNSAGCIHIHPDDCEALYESLAAMGVESRPNPFSGKNYQYECQGIMVIEQLD